MNYIKEILREKNLTVSELAVKLGISRQALSKQIQGKMLVETAERIAIALEVPLWQLFASPEEMVSDNFISFLYYKGMTRTPTSINEVMDVLMDWDKAQFINLCKGHFFDHLNENYKQNAEIMKLKDTLISLLDIENQSETNHKEQL